MPSGMRRSDPVKIGVAISRPNPVSLRPSSPLMPMPMMEKIVQTTKHAANANVLTHRILTSLDLWSAVRRNSSPAQIFKPRASVAAQRDLRGSGQQGGTGFWRLNRQAPGVPSRSRPSRSRPSRFLHFFATMLSAAPRPLNRGYVRSVTFIKKGRWRPSRFCDGRSAALLDPRALRWTRTGPILSKPRAKSAGWPFPSSGRAPACRLWCRLGNYCTTICQTAAHAA
jgi:hypothetical protein